MALYKYHYIELDTKRSPRISLQNIVAGETGNRLIITVKNNGETVDMSEKSNGEFIYRVCLKIDSDLGTRRQDSAQENSGITFIEAATGDHGKINILLSADSFTAGKNRCRLEIYSKRSEEDDTLICSAEWTFDAAGNPTGENSGTAYPVMAYYEQLAKSWAKGGTGKREGEDTDNSKFYSDMAQEAVEQQVVAPSITAWLTANYPDIADDMADDISAWLSAHMTNPSNPAIDTSLSVSGAAADAKETGLAKQMVMLPFDLENEHYSLECIHHDNFCRTPETEFDIGQNGNETVPMTYTFDQDSNDVFKIVDNVLTAASGGSTRRTVITNKPNRNFAVTLGLVTPTTTSKIWTSFYWNRVNGQNYSDFRISRKLYNGNLQSTVYVTKKVSNVETMLLQNSGYEVTGDSVTLVFLNDNLYIYCDNTLLYTVADVTYDKSKECGISITSITSTWMWKSISIFNIVTSTTVDAGTDADRRDYNKNDGNKLVNSSITQALSGSVYEYLLNRDPDVTRFSPYSERFVLKYIAGASTSAKNDSRRSEVTINQKPKGCLFRSRVSFDFCLPSDYQPETDPAVANGDNEVIAQFHYTSTGGVVGYNPTPTLSIYNGDLYISQWGRPEQDMNWNDSPAVTKSEEILKTLTPGRWYHIDLFVRSGYEAAHNPLVEVKIDGELVYRSTALNCPNTVGAVAFHYGIYKAQWYERRVGYVLEKKYYFDNMKVRWF